MRGVRTAEIALALAATLGSWHAARAATPVITARAALVMDAATGEVLWERNGHQPLPPASTTKVMTAILAIESERLGESFRVSAEAAETPPSKINLRPGQRMQLRNLLYALLLNSANDAAEVVAEGLADSEEMFAARMTVRARELGADTAHFANPHGLTAAGHVASAHDLAVIFRHGMRLPLFREILETRTVRVPVESGEVHWISLRSHNRLLSGYTYPVIGKTGYTRPAKRCFVGAGTHDGRELIIAVLGATDLWGDAKRLFALGFGAGADRPPVVMAGLAPTLHAAPSASVVHPEGDDEASPEVRDAAASRFSVQLGPYPSRRTAVATRSRLARRGYTAILTGRALRVGSFSSRTRAQRLAGRLRSTGYQATVVALR
jgi:serine-type D-Ala-D-Ala carboxypeptidase (penicillin-binding protein 5/6)